MSSCTQTVYKTCPFYSLLFFDLDGKQHKVKDSPEGELMMTYNHVAFRIKLNCTAWCCFLNLKHRGNEYGDILNAVQLKSKFLSKIIQLYPQCAMKQQR